MASIIAQRSRVALGISWRWHGGGNNGGKMAYGMAA